MGVLGITLVRVQRAANAIRNEETLVMLKEAHFGHPISGGEAIIERPRNTTRPPFRQEDRQRGLGKGIRQFHGAAV